LSDQHSLDPRYDADWSQVDEVISMMKNDWNMLSICDIVLNHTAKESKWLHEHPECSYNCSNSPHLRPAFLLDRMLYQVTLDVADGKLEQHDIPKGVINAAHHLDNLERIIHKQYLPQLKLHEFFMVDVDKIVKEFAESSCLASGKDEQLVIIQDPQRKRFGGSIDMSVAKYQFSNNNNKEGLKERLENLNHKAYQEVQDHMRCAITNVLNGAKYERLDCKGPKVWQCNPKSPLICQYFTCNNEDTLDLKELEEMMYDEQVGQYYMVHNGWVMGMDPSIDFASSKSMVYLRRELVAWGDCVKLNYGTCPQDNPFLWQYMKDYVEQVAHVFHGVRLDNCHSTPIHVAEYLLDAARKIQPDLYVIAELFTGSEGTDNKYLNRLGINSLIREGLRAWNSHELGRLVYHYGGAVVGSFDQPHIQPLQPCRVAHAILFDQTHDNQSAVELRTAYDYLPSSALCLMACCAFGSNRGFDELVPHHIHVVNETRPYSHWDDCKQAKKGGMIDAKKALNELHYMLGKEGYNEVFVDQMDADVVAITRHNPVSHQTVVLVSHTAFNSGVNIDRAHTGLWLKVEGQLLEVVLEANLHKTQEASASDFIKNKDYINGLDNFVVDLRTHIPIKESKFVRLASSSQEAKARIELFNFRPGSVVACRFQLNPDQNKACLGLQELLKDHQQDLQAIVNRLTLSDLNHVLFKSDQEEQDDIGVGVYSLDGYGPLKYAGLQGVMSILAEIRPINDLGNWLPDNLRSGDWMLDYIINRLKKKTTTSGLGDWFEQKAFKLLRSVPRYLVPRYFDSIISMVYCHLLDQTW
jgi:glycogen debranching enzyme